MPPTAPALSTPAENILTDQPAPAASAAPPTCLSDAEFEQQYEIARTVRELRVGKWRRIALQFPDEMLRDAPRVYEMLRDRLKAAVKEEAAAAAAPEGEPEPEKEETRLCILGDTSYGACCVDEIAAEHVDAQVVVHYGRACLSATARLPVVYVFTSAAVDVARVAEAVERAYGGEKGEKVCLMADIPYAHCVGAVAGRLREQGWENVFPTEVVRDTASLIPNRTLPEDVRQDREKLGEYSLFHISQPPAALLLILSSRLKRFHIYPTDASFQTSASASLAHTTPLLKRRYALLTRLPSVPIIGILIATLSTSNYTSAIAHCERLIRAVGKKPYTFVVGKLNPAKLANFAEVGMWVAVGCWESSLVEGEGFWRGVVTVFELEVGLRGEGREWGGEWGSDFQAVLDRERMGGRVGGVEADKAQTNGDQDAAEQENWQDQDSDDSDAPPDFDLRTGQYVARTRAPRTTKQEPASSTALSHRPKSDLAIINGTVSAGAQYLRDKKTWTGLGSERNEIAYERDEEGRIRGAGMEEGRGGVAKGYAVGGEGEG